MDNLELFTDKQKDTYIKVKKLRQQITNSIDPTTFVLNSKTVALSNELIQLQNQCDHKYDDDGVCMVCGKEE